MNKPNLFLIGSPKCGTTALAMNLAQHKDIYLPKQKEPRYFDRTIFYDYEEEYFTKTLDEYLAFYQDVDDSKYMMDASVFNMYKQESIEGILALSPDAKFIIILRDPIESSISMHRQRLTYIDTKMRELSDDFNECWNLLEKRKRDQGYPKGCRNKFLFRYDLLYSYENYLPYLRERLGNKLFIGFYEDYKEKPEDFFEKLFVFLGIEKIEVENKKMNNSLILKESIVLNTLELLQKYTLPLRKKIGLSGLKGLKTKVLEFYKQDKKRVEVDKKIYEYFQPTYEYLEKLKDELKD